MLVLLSGLPGSGKSALGDELGRQLSAAVLSVDPIEAAMLRCGIPRSFATGVAAYEVAAVLAEYQLQLDLTVIGDAVNSLEVGREMWRRAARRADAQVVVIEVVCSDVDLHRSRLAARTRDINGFPEPTWDDVLARRDEWEQWPEDRLVVDSVSPLADNVERVLAHLQLGS